MSTLCLWLFTCCVIQVPLLFACIFTPGLTGGDLGAALSVGVFWVLSGYVNTCSYLVSMCARVCEHPRVVSPRSVQDMPI